MLIADVCLLVFTVLAYIIPQRKDQIDYVREIVTANVGRILERKPHSLPGMTEFDNAKSVILKNRFSLMLGYLADVLFSSDEMAFKQTIEFLIESIGQSEGIDEVVAMGCVDTVVIIVTDHDVAPRLLDHLDYILTQLSQLIGRVKFVNFFDFINDFVKLFAKPLAESQKIHFIMHAVINRILAEQQAHVDGSHTDKSDMIIDKCCTNLRICVENGNYMPAMKEQFEETLKPIFLYLGEPEKISFVDDILLIVKGMIRKSKQVTPLMWEIFEQFTKVITKSKGQLGDLFDTVNLYMVHGKEEFA